MLSASHSPLRASPDSHSSPSTSDNNAPTPITVINNQRIMETSTSSINKLEQKVGFIGGGKMALALAKGFMASGLIAPSQVMTSAPSDNNLMLWRQLGAATTHVNSEVVIACDVIFLAVKPNIFPAVMAELEVMRIEDVEGEKIKNGTSGEGENIISPNTR